MLYLLPTTLPAFHQASVLVIGDVMLDRYWFGDTNRISPEAPVPIVKINNMDNRPGGAANVALNLAALGVKTYLLGITGQDEAAAILTQQLTAAGVIHALQQSSAISTIVKLRVISRHQQLLRVDFEEKLHLKEADRLIEQYQAHLPYVNLVILSDYQKGTLLQAKRFIQLAKAANIPVIVDPKGLDVSLYQQATLITPNLKEFEAIVGPCDNEKTIIQKGQTLLAEHQINSLLLTRGEDGMTLIQPTDVMHFPAFAREVVDVTGAGDTVISTLAASLSANESLSTAVALANLAASMTVGKLGAATVSPPELEVALSGKTSYQTGVVNEDQLLAAIKEVRTKGKKIVFTNGCFDILHAGHVEYLQLAKQLGDYLVVAVNADESIQQLKGPNRPINHLEHRMMVLASLGVVDWVVPFSTLTPEPLLYKIRPDLLVKGGDYTIDGVVGASIVRAYGGEVRVIASQHSTSSSSIINRITNTQQKVHQSSVDGEL